MSTTSATLTLPRSRTFGTLYYDIAHHREELDLKSLAILKSKLLPLLHPVQMWMSPSEFGMSVEDKLRIGVSTTWKLVQKVANDLEFMLEETTESGQVRNGILRFISN